MSRRPPRRDHHLLLVCLLAILLLLTLATPVAPLGAQGTGVGWNGETEGNASLFFGNTSQWLVAARTRLARRDSTMELRGETRVSYAQATTDSGTSIVTARSWLVDVNINYQPFSHWSPFIQGTVESSLERRVDRRYAAGAGAKYAIIRRDSTQLDVSIAALGEWIHPLDGTADSTLVTSRLRWSGQLHLEQQLGPRVRFTHTTLYQPSVRELAQYTITSSTVLGVDLTKVLALTLTLQDVYDSEAVERGARSNNAGQFLIGLKARY